MRTSLATATLLVVIIPAPSARAQVVQVAIEDTAGACPALADLGPRVEAAIATPDRSDRPPASVRVIVDAGAPLAADVEVTLGASPAARHITARDCADLVDAAVLVVALAIGELEGASAPAPVEPAPVVTPVAPPDDARRDDAAEAPAASAVWLGVAGGVAWGALPASALAVELGVDVELPLARVGVVASVLPAGAVLVQGEQARIDMTLAALAPHVCFDVSLDPARLGGCVRVDAGVLRASSTGVEQGDDVLLPWLAVGLSVEAGILLGPSLRVDVALAAELTPTRPRLQLDGVTVHQAEVASVLGTIRVSYRIARTGGAP